VTWKLEYFTFAKIINNNLLNSKVMKKVLLVCMLFISTMFASAQLSQHGLLLNGGFGSVDVKIDKGSISWDDMEYKGGTSIGYRLRFKKPTFQSFHYDVDVKGGAYFTRNMNWSYFIFEGYPNANGEPVNIIGFGGSGGHWLSSYISLGGTANYTLINNLSVGLGLEPTYIFKPSGNESLNKFDIPVTAKIAYNLKFVEVGLYGKYGLMNIMDKTHPQSGKIRELHLSIFIPFKSL
jgi:hypothetical protein